MSNAKHTIGIWKRDGLFIFGKVNGQPTHIATAEQLPCIDGYDDMAAQRAFDEERANARLIAAAPELLEALELIRDTAKPLAQRDGGKKIYGFDMEAVLSAIAKAKGE